MEDILKSSLFEAFASASEYVYIYVCDMKTGMSRWSPNSVEYFGLPGEYIDNAGELWGQHVHPDDRELYFDDIGGVFSGKTPRHSCQYRAKNRYGEYVWLECKGTAIRDEQGELAVFAGLMTRLDNQNKYDTLTGLLTGSEFYNYDLTGKKGIAILIGVDDFRQVISIFGYSFGDRVLVELARNISALCSEGQMVYRFTGDEFMLLLPDGERQEAEELFEKISQAAEKISLEDGRRVGLSISAGAAQYSPEDSSRDVLINHLELSMEYIKKQHKGKMLFYCQDIEEKHLRMAMIREDLKRSIRNGFQGFELYFQPWVDGSGNGILGCEALLRWKGEQIKDAGPMEFIPILENDGDIISVGHWVMEQAIRQQKLWQDRYGDFKVSFNVSYQQFLEKNYVEELVETAEKYDVKPSHMVLELTESCNVDSPENLAAVFQALREKGFSIALDDFGTAYASMELLKKLPADCIKIEHSFVRELEKSGHEIDISIVEALLFLCRKLGCQSVVEGVENKGVDEIIRAMDATYLQGYYYSRPVCQTDFEAMLNENRKQQGSV